ELLEVAGIRRVLVVHGDRKGADHCVRGAREVMRARIRRAAVEVGLWTDVVAAIEAGLDILVVLGRVGAVETEAASRKEVQRMLSPLRAQLQARIYRLDKAADPLGCRGVDIVVKG